MKKYFGFLLLLLVAAGCKDEAPTGVSEPGLGSVTVNKYISIGNSLTAGYLSQGLFEDGQIYSFPNLIAGQLKAAGAPLGTFQQPIWGNPGSPNKDGNAARLEILDWPSTGPVISSRNVPKGIKKNDTLNRPYDNLGIPFAHIADFLDTADFTQKSNTPQTIFFGHVLRNKSYGSSVLDQARRITPKADIITFWLGNNDVLIYAISGGVAVINNTVVPFSPTNSATFAAEYAKALDSLRAAFPIAKIIVANIPDILAIPHFTTVNAALLGETKGVVSINYQMHGTTGAANAASFLTEKNPPMFVLGAGSYVGKLGMGSGDGSGKWYEDNGVPVPAGVDTNYLFGTHPKNPIPDALILDSTEIATARIALAAFNQTIASVAQAKGAVLVDVHSIFNEIHKNGLKIGATTFTTKYIEGGLFSLDGIHPSQKGAGVVANEFIKVMNAKFGMNVGLVDISKIPGIPAPLKKYASSYMLPKISARDIEHMKYMWR